MRFRLLFRGHILTLSSGIEAPCVDEVLIGRLGVQVEAGFSRFAFTVAVAAVFQCKDLPNGRQCRSIPTRDVEWGRCGS